jgi:hypothetical protein
MQETHWQTFSPPVQVNHRPNSVTVGGERGPKALVTQDGTLHVLWLGDYRKGGGVWYTRSRDNGHTFEPERNLEDRPAGCDGAAIAGQGRRLFAFWLDSRGGEDSQNPVTGTLVMATSADGGMSWSPTVDLGSGKQVLLWREAERICWVEIAKGAQASQRRGTLPSRGSNAFGAFVDPRGRLVIVD